MLPKTLHVSQASSIMCHVPTRCKLRVMHFQASVLRYDEGNCAECFYYIVVIVKTPEIIQKKNKAQILYKIKQFT